MALLKKAVKDILLKINPVYRTLQSIKSQLEGMEKMITFFCKDDSTYLHTDVPEVKMAHVDYLSKIGNKKGIKVLEVGSRVVTGQNFRNSFSEAEYVGFDFYPGENVDIVGDAHKLSEYFGENEKFDIIFSMAVFEHFAMPWIVAKEITKLLKIGGYVLTGTHFSYSSHERPWHFFQFSDMALKVLFSPALGIETIDAGMGNSIVGRFSSLCDRSIRNTPVTGLYCSAHFLGKKIREVENFEWEQINLLDVVGETKYPEPK
jgi:SAM-dependent methyltransferase